MEYFVVLWTGNDGEKWQADSTLYPERKYAEMDAQLQKFNRPSLDFKVGKIIDESEGR